jgi:hypothetical protein
MWHWQQCPAVLLNLDAEIVRARISRVQVPNCMYRTCYRFAVTWLSGMHSTLTRLHSGKQSKSAINGAIILMGHSSAVRGKVWGVFLGEFNDGPAGSCSPLIPREFMRAQVTAGGRTHRGLGPALCFCSLLMPVPARNHIFRSAIYWLARRASYSDAYHLASGSRTDCRVTSALWPCDVARSIGLLSDRLRLKP